MFLNDRSQRLRAFKNKKNKNEKTLKLRRFELNDTREFINEKTLIIKWETTALESFDSWTENLLNRFFINRFENDLSNENDIKENVS